MKDFTSKMRKFFAVAIAVIILSATLVAPTGVGAATVTEDSKLSEYVCDFEDNYGKSVPGTIAEENGSNAMNFLVGSNASTHFFEINNSQNGDLKIANGNVYAVKISYRVERISSATQAEIMTSINLVRYSGTPGTLVKIKTFSGATFNPGETTGWVTSTIVFKATIADSPQFDRLAINVVSPSCPSNETNDQNSKTSIWFDDIVVTECVGTTSTIDFQTNGGSNCDVLMAQAGETITLPTPTRDLYDFAGWYTDSSLKKEFKSTKMPSTLITKLYAKWEVSASAIKVEFADAYDSNVQMLVGRVGDSISLPSPKRSGFHFAGWYMDKGYKEKCNYKTFPNESAILYAKWEVVPFFCGFENKSDYGVPNDATFTKRCEVLKEGALNGEHALSYNYWKGSQTEKQYQWRAIAGVLLINEHGEKMQVVPGATYTIEFQYKINKMDAQNKGNKIGSFGAILSAQGGAWDNRAVMIQGFADEAVNYDKKDVGKGWQKGKLTFVAEPNGNKLQNAYLSIGIAGDAELVVDNVCVYQVDKKAPYNGKCMISFEPNGGNYCETVYGNFGDAITMPENPEREGYRFMGWYTDPDCNIMFDDTATFSNGYRKLYADWYLIPVEEPVEEPIEDILGGEPEDKPNNMLMYILIGVAAVVVLGVVVVLIVTKKKKANTAE